jgi:hypothetical protein
MWRDKGRELFTTRVTGVLCSVFSKVLFVPEFQQSCCASKAVV